MAAIQELSAELDIEVHKTYVRLFRLGQSATNIPFNQIPALSRACSVVKESPEYDTYLKRKGLA